MFETRITRLLGIEYPIIQGGMGWLSRAELAAAVSSAGGLGIIASASLSSEELREEIKKAKDMTDKPLGVNVPLFPQFKDKLKGHLEVLIDEGIKAVETAGRTPESIVPDLKNAGVKIIHKVPAVRFALKAESAGVDAVAVVGFECGGHPGMDDFTTLILIPRAVDSLKIPVIGAGGIGDGRGFAAALALGAEGVLMGTRFMATKECMAHPSFKEWLVKAKETDTMMIERSVNNPARVMKNNASKKILDMEKKGAPIEDMITIRRTSNRVLSDGDVEAGVVSCGQVVGLIEGVLTVKELIERIISEAKDICSYLGSFKF